MSSFRATSFLQTASSSQSVRSSTPRRSRHGSPTTRRSTSTRRTARSSPPASSTWSGSFYLPSLPLPSAHHSIFAQQHSHIGVDQAPGLSGASDTNSVAKPILPYLRSLDGINTHDLSYKRSVSGGVTSSLILPGSANNIGGQAFVIKLRPTKEKTPDSLVLEMPYHIPTPNRTQWLPEDPPRWRHMKCVASVT